MPVNTFTHTNTHKHTQRQGCPLLFVCKSQDVLFPKQASTLQMECQSWYDFGSHLNYCLKGSHLSSRIFTSLHVVQFPYCLNVYNVCALLLWKKDKHFPKKCNFNLSCIRFIFKNTISLQKYLRNTILDEVILNIVLIAILICNW